MFCQNIGKKARKMKINVTVCHKCAKQLDPISRKFYLFLCRISLGRVLFFEKHRPFLRLIIRKLEKKKFLVSTEVQNNDIAIFIKGYQIDIEGFTQNHTYCLNNNVHAKRD